MKPWMVHYWSRKKAFDRFDVQVSFDGRTITMITNLRYAADNTLIARTSEELLELIEKVKATVNSLGSTSISWYVAMNYNKTRWLMEKTLINPGDQHDQMDTFNFLRSKIVKDSGSSIDIRRRLVMAKPKHCLNTFSNILEGSLWDVV